MSYLNRRDKDDQFSNFTLGQRRTSRRTFLTEVGSLGGCGAAFTAMQALGLLPAPAEAAAVPPPQNPSGAGKKVVVLGAGIAGLVSAYELRKLGFDVTVIEARARPGGRNWSIRKDSKVEFTDGTTQTCTWADDQYMNAGPARIPSIHSRLLNYCREFSVPMEVEINSSKSALMQADSLNGGRAVRQRQVDFDTRGYIAELLAKSLHADTLDLPLTKDDRQQMLDFIRKYGDLRDDAYVGSERAGYSIPPEAGPDGGKTNAPLSLHEMLVADLSKGELYEDQIYWQATMFQPVGGMDRIAYAFAERLGPVIHYECPVEQVHKTAGGVRIVFSKHGSQEALEADFCLCTLPATVMRHLEMDVSPAHKAAISQFVLSSSYKIGWESPRFWEQENDIYGGISFLRQDVDLIWYPSADLFAPNGILLGGFGNETELDGTPTPFGRLGTVQAKLAASRAAVERLHPGRSHLLERPILVSWNNIPYSLGAVANNKPSEREAYRQLNVPDGPILFAGDYLSHLAGWQEGAVYSADRAVVLLCEKVRGAAAARH